MAKGELKPVWTPEQLEVIQGLADRLDRFAREAEWRKIAERHQQHEADSVLLNSLVWMLRVQLGDAVAPGGNINRETLVEDVRSVVCRTFEDAYQRGYREGKAAMSLRRKPPREQKT